MNENKYIEKDFHGYPLIEFDIDGRTALLVRPKNTAEGAPWLLKTEYFDAFPEFELEMLSRGWHVAYVANKTRWHDASDDDAKAALAKRLSAEFSLSQKCVTVGMSCGGMHSIYFASKYPELVAGLYLDAPVVNLLSCPCGIGKTDNESLYEEFVSHTGMTKSSLINYRNHPYDHLGALVENNIPVFLVCGDCDLTVSYEENGKALYEYISSRGGNIIQIVTKGRGHHPHGLIDLSPLVEFAEAARQSRA